MIQAKQKKCAGIGKAFGFSGCGANSFKRTFGLCDSCLIDFYFNDERGKIIYAKLKGSLRHKKEKAFKSDLRQKLKKLSYYEAEAKKSFQKWVRFRDKGNPCKSCKNPNPADEAGGHYFPAGIYSGLMFDERNCHLQCNTYCNKHLSGNPIEYRKNLIEEFGEDWMKQLEEDANRLRNYKYNKDELISIKVKYDQKIKNEFG